MHRWNTAVLKVTLTLKKDGCGSLSRNIFTRKIFSRAQHKSCGVRRGEKHCVCLSLKTLSLSSTITTKLYTCTHTQGSGGEVTGKRGANRLHSGVVAVCGIILLLLHIWELLWRSAYGVCSERALPCLSVLHTAYWETSTKCWGVARLRH